MIFNCRKIADKVRSVSTFFCCSSYEVFFTPNQNPYYYNNRGFEPKDLHRVWRTGALIENFDNIDTYELIENTNNNNSNSGNSGSAGTISLCSCDLEMLCIFCVPKKVLSQSSFIFKLFVQRFSCLFYICFIFSFSQLPNHWPK